MSPPQFPSVRQQVLAGSAIPFAFMSREIDGLTEAVYDFEAWPSLPGFKPIDTQVRGFWTFLEATSLTTPPTISIGTNDPDFNNLLSNTAALPSDAASAAAMLAAGGGGLFLGDALELAGEVRLPDLVTPPRILLSDAAVGVGFGRVSFRILVMGYLVNFKTIVPG